MGDKVSSDDIIEFANRIMVSKPDNENKSEETRPLARLIKRLINGHDNKQETVLTNSQIVDMLQKELHVDILGLHVLEVDIYMNIMKKYLKEWPRWDEFDNIIMNTRNGDEVKTLEKILDQEYNTLKTYLKNKLELSMPMVNEVVQKVKEDDVATSNEYDQGNTSGVIMEIQCSREHLNHLFYRRPHPKHQNTIFNIAEVGPSRIMLNTLTLPMVLNWYFVYVNIHLNIFTYKRAVLPELKHMLINKKLRHSTLQPMPLDQNLKVKLPKNVLGVRKENIIKLINKIGNTLLERDPLNRYAIENIFEIVTADLRDLPDEFLIPASYRKHWNKYGYIRYLYQDVDTDEVVEGDIYDLQLEEKISPRCEFYIGKAKTEDIHFNLESSNWLWVGCLFCQQQFELHSIMSFIQHFKDFHHYEPDWQCTNCKKTFPMTTLAMDRWCHDC